MVCMKRLGFGLLAMGVVTGMQGSALEGDVDLVKSLHSSASSDWQGRVLADVLAIDDVQRLVLLKAVTSAPGDIDLANIRRMIEDAAASPLDTTSSDSAPFNTGSGLSGLLSWGSKDSVWEAVVLTRSGAVFGLLVKHNEDRADTDQRHRLCLATENGEWGCFAIPEPERDGR